MRRIVAADIGGTHARFALADIAGSQVISLDGPVKLRTSQHASLQTAWEEFGRRKGIDLPTDAALAFAGPIEPEVVKLTNNPWAMNLSLIKERLSLERVTIVNDFGAVGHAVAALPEQCFQTICGPDRPLPDRGVISVIGPGTGLGVSVLLRKADAYEVIETEGGHVDFAPLDALEDQILAELRRSFRRVSVERIASGRGLWNLYEALAAIEGHPLTLHDEKELWAAALKGGDGLANAALDRLCLTLGSFAADMALAHGAVAVVIGGGVGLRLADHLARSGFKDRFVAKGRFERRMDDVPVKLIKHPEPGLFGAAAAFARQFREVGEGS